MFGLHLIGEVNTQPSNQEFVRIHNSIRWLMACNWNFRLANFGLEQFYKIGELEIWPDSAFYLFEIARLYFTMLDNFAICVHQRYEDKVNPAKIYFGKPKAWPTSIPSEIRCEANTITESAGWQAFKDDYRNAIMHRQFPIFQNAWLTDPDFQYVEDWAEIKAGHVTFGNNPNVRYADDYKYVDGRLQSMWDDDEIVKHIRNCVEVIRKCCRLMYEKSYIQVQEIE